MSRPRPELEPVDRDRDDADPPTLRIDAGVRGRHREAELFHELVSLERRDTGVVPDRDHDGATRLNFDAVELARSGCDVAWCLVAWMPFLDCLPAEGREHDPFAGRVPGYSIRHCQCRRLHRDADFATAIHVIDPVRSDV